MRFTFKADDAIAKGLRVIPEIPDVRLAQLEGQNGIGKTLAARLLELISGEMPFAALPKAWDSLVENLGVVEISVEGLPEGLLEVRLDSASWRDRTQAQCAQDPGEVALAGRPVDWSQVRRHLQVRRIAGDEGLAETLGRTLRERSIEADNGRQRISPLVAEWSQQLEALVEVTSWVTPTSLKQLRANAAGAGRQLLQAEKEANTAAQAADAATQTESILRGVVAAAEELPDLVEAYSSRISSHNDAKTHVVGLEAELADAGAAQVFDAQRTKEIRHWTRLLDLRQTALTRARLSERQMIGYLGLESRPDRSEMKDLRESTQQALAEARKQLKTVDMAGTLRTATTEVEATLSGLPSAARSETVADLDRPLSADELLDGVRRRRDALREIPRPGQALELDRQVLRLNDRLRALQQLPSFIETTNRKSTNVAEAEERLFQLYSLSAAEKTARHQLQEDLAHWRDALLSASTEAVQYLSRIGRMIGREEVSGQEPIDSPDSLPSIDESDEELDDAAFEAAETELESAVQSILRTPEEVRREIDEWFAAQLAQVWSFDDQREHEDLGWDLADSLPRLHGWLAEISERAAAERESTLHMGEHLDDLRRSADEVAAALKAQRLSIATAIKTLTDQDGDWSEIASSVRDALDAADYPHEATRITPEGFLGAGLSDAAADLAELSAASVLEMLAQVAERLEDSAARTRDAWGTVSAYLSTETHRLAPRLAGPDPWTLSGLTTRGSAVVLHSWTEGEIGRILSADALRSELFEGAAEVAFDLTGLAVAWRTPDGRRRRRPLEAFSSGEQVFAYTRAKLETFRSLRDSTEHLTVFLDEFGAFVARDRFSQLLAYVQREALGEIADQVVVMLPLTASDVQQALASRSTDNNAHDAFVSDGYFVISAESERVS